MLRLSFSCLLCTVLMASSGAAQQTEAVVATTAGPVFVAVQAQDGAPGSTMTLRQLQKSDKTDDVPEPLVVSAAGEPSPALRYRLYPQRADLKPGSAILHYTRAQMMYQQLPKERTSVWQRWFSDDKEPTSEELTAAIAEMTHVYSELHELALSEDFTWDHRIRDLRGPAVYSYLLPDVQEVRAMARLLNIRARHQLRSGDFDGAFSTISDGFRLAEFVGQGETLIQKLVGIACASIMRSCLEEAVSTPGCPNLYWALATVPQPLINVTEAVTWELGNVRQVFTALSDAETGVWTEAQATDRWKQLTDELQILGGLEGSGQGQETRLSLAIASVSFVETARERLKQRGIAETRIAELPALQLVLLDASLELERVGDDMAKAHLLPFALADQVLEREEKKFQDWLRDERMTSPGAAIAGLLFPAIRQSKQAETRMLLGHNRLMTLEALRMHAATHEGALPESLDLLAPVPAMPDPYSNRPLEYRIEETGDQRTIVLIAAGPTNFRPLQELRIQIRK